MSEKSRESKRRKMALGRGLDSLIPDIDPFKDEKGSGFFECDTDLIRPNPYQPRQQFDQDELERLAESIRSQGVIQPLIVRKAPGGYELIAGERRLKAAIMAGKSRVPVIVKEIGNAEMIEMSIVENIQRQDLNPLEEAEAYHRLITEFNMTQEKASQRVGKSRSTVANFLRLRQLPDEVKEKIRDGLLSMGHARALLALEKPARIKAAMQTVIGRGLSVRQTEALVKRIIEEPKNNQSDKKSTEEIYFLHLSEELSQIMGTKVSIRRRGKKGRLMVEFYSDEDLDRILSILKRTG